MATEHWTQTPPPFGGGVGITTMEFQIDVDSLFAALNDNDGGDVPRMGRAPGTSVLQGLVLINSMNDSKSECQHHSGCPTSCEYTASGGDTSPGSRTPGRPPYTQIPELLRASGPPLVGSWVGEWEGMRTKATWVHPGVGCPTCMTLPTCLVPATGGSLEILRKVPQR